jgi:hypothetical protein
VLKEWPEDGPVWPKHVAPLIKPLLTPYYSKESCDLTVINKVYIYTLHNGMGTIKYQILLRYRLLL